MAQIIIAGDERGFTVEAIGVDGVVAHATEAPTLTDAVAAALVIKCEGGGAPWRTGGADAVAFIERDESTRRLADRLEALAIAIRGA